MTLSQITADVAALLGESLVLECETEESPFPDFTSRVRLLIPEVLSDLYLSSPKILLTGWKRLAGTLSIDTATATATLALPDDYFMLGSIRLSGWSHSVEEALSPGAPALAGIGSDIPGVMPDRHRPAAVEEIMAGGTRCLRLYGAADSDAIVSATYMPFPAIREDAVDVPVALYPRLISYIAKKLNDQN